ncbi:pyroglutamyl-peptidase I [Labedella phragmitis]|uniref:Pyrrolidone-carboxylate peptidase n=1 Tax=Labedella phragmitis TaxID=2498849 RepID=A0A444PV37_9MICO|nr:pyroglutamyl-peptidase I [Labedella phragmitis]RWZ51746.1 pyroglutamyl-peptidase I [Labedella phragmitis]
MTVVLVTGFEPFGGSAVNASEEAVRLLPRRIGEVDVVTAILPCVFGDAPRELEALVGEHRPDIVIAVGEAGSRSTVDLERVAINIDDARIPDNAGNRPIDSSVVDGAPSAYFSTLPVKACTAAAEGAGVATSVSNSAGTFVCNHVFFALMHLISDAPDVRGGFVHVPTVDALPTVEAVRGLTAILEAAAHTAVDRHESRGTEQ